MVRTLISTVYEGGAVKVAITKLSPDRVVLIGADWPEPNRKSKLKKTLTDLKKTFDFLDITVTETDLYDAPKIAQDVAKIIDSEQKKGNEVLVHISESRKTQALGALFASYARREKVKAVYYIEEESNKLRPLPLLSFQLSNTKKQLLKLIEKGINNPKELMKRIGKEKSLVYAYLKELRDQGYLTEENDLTDAGKICII